MYLVRWLPSARKHHLAVSIKKLISEQKEINRRPLTQLDRKINLDEITNIVFDLTKGLYSTQQN